MARHFPPGMRISGAPLVAACVALLVLAPTRPAAALEPGRPLSHYGVRNWTTDSGLPQNTVSALVQTRDGYLWMGTQDGLVRFDGIRFAVFTRRNTPALPDDWVQSLAEGPDGTLWIGTVGGLARYRDGQFEHWRRASSLEKFLAQHIVVARDGTAWVGTNRGLLEIRGDTFTVHGPATGLPVPRVRSIFEDAAGDIWAGANGMIFRRHAGAWSQIDPQSSGPVSAITQTSNGELWIAAGLTLLRWDGAKFCAPASIETVLSGNFVRTLRAGNDGSIWIAGGDGLRRFREGRIDRFDPSSPLGLDGVQSLAMDREGTLWVGTMDGGLLQVSDRRVTNLGAPDGLEDEKMWTVFADPDGTLWTGSARGVLSRRDPGASRFVRVAAFGSPILAIDRDPAGVLWVGTQADGLKRFARGRWTELRRSDGLSSNWISGLCATCPGGLWVATMGGGITVLPGNGKDPEKILMKDGAIPSDAIFSIASDPDGSVWVGTFGGGLARLRGAQHRLYTTKEGLAHDIVAAVLPEADGTVWVGTRGGLSRFRDGRWTAYRSQDGLYYDAIQAVVDDRQGHLWMSSTAGIFRVAKSELHAFAEGRVRRITSLALGVADGMRNAECNNGPHGGVRAPDGILHFATMKGVAAIDPSRVRGNPVPPLIALERVVVNGESHPGRAAVQIPPGRRRNVEFHYAGLSLRRPELVRFRYRLHGFDEAWRDAGSRRVAFYTNIPPGRYRFEVQAANESGIWSRESAGVALTLARPFTQAPWFYLLCALPLIGAGVLLHRLRLSRIEARERLRTALVEAQLHALQSQLRPHFLFNTLNTILPLIGRDPDRARRMVLQLGDLLRLSLKSQATQLLTLEEELHILGLYLGIEQTRFRGLEVSVEADPDVRDALLPGFLLQPLVENAIKHGLDHRTSRGRVGITARADGDRLSLRIRDAGPGYFPPQAPSFPAAAGGIGLANTRSRLEKLYPGRHSFEISNPPGGGCEVWISLPLEHQGPLATERVEAMLIRAAN